MDRQVSPPVDPVSHTLFGAALAQTGLKDRTRWGTATLLIGANLPDVDVVAYAWSPVHALWFRRGATHGVLGLVVLPLLLTACVLAWDRLVRRRRGSVRPARVSPVALLAFLAVLSHPVLDSLNVYGMRWVVPFSTQWIYADTLFILDPWVWAILAGGVFLASRGSPAEGTGRGRPAVVALVILAVYVGVMGLSNIAGRRVVRRTFEGTLGVTPERIMVAPVPVTPFSRYVVVDVGGRYRFGTLRWFRRPSLTVDSLIVDRRPAHYAATAATRGPVVRKFLSWARFPFYEIDDVGDRFVVHIGDARYTRHAEGSWAGVSVEVGK